MKNCRGTELQTKETASVKALRLNEIRKCVCGTENQNGLIRVNKDIEGEEVSRGQITKTLTGHFRSVCWECIYCLI